jgi:lipoprotein NlpI
VERFNQSLALNPNAAETHQNLGVALMGLRDFAAAVAQFEMALSIRPNYPIASHNLAIARRRLAGESGNEQQQN